MKYRARFPESLFQVRHNRLRSYNQEIVRSYEICSNHNLLIIGLAKNCEKTIGVNIDRCVELGRFFKRCEIFILENGSIDYTPQILKEKSIEYSNVSFISEKSKQPKFDSISRERFRYMSDLRNMLKDNAPTGDFSRMIVYDFDIVGGFSYDGVVNSAALMRGNAVVSNGIIYQDNKRKMYDYIAYREQYPDKEDYSCANLVFDKGEEMVKICSGFGGLGVYNYQEAMKHRYAEDFGCEHVAFHYGMNVYLNPNQIVLYNETNYTK